MQFFICGGYNMKNLSGKLLAFDLDDTLLTTEKKVSPAVCEALWKCSELGAKIGYITTRATRMVDNFLEGLPKDFLACYGGAMIEINGEIVKRHEIEYMRGKQIIDYIKARKPDIDVEVYMEPYSYKLGGVMNLNTKEIVKCAFEDIEPQNIQRIMIQGKYDVPLEFFSEIDISDLNVFKTRGATIMMTHPMSVKENSLGIICEYLNVDINDTIAFGDDISDLGMIKAAGVGVAMGNSIEEVKIAADFVIDTNDNGGIAKWISKNLL